MGFLDAILGGRKRLSAPAADRLFAMSTAAVTLETGLGMKSRGVAAIVFQQIANADFKQIVTDAEELLKSAAKDTGTQLEQKDDDAEATEDLEVGEDAENVTGGMLRTPKGPAWDKLK